MIGAASKLHSSDMLDEFAGVLYNSLFSGNFDFFRVAVFLPTISACLPFITYKCFKDSYKHLKTAIKYPNID